MNKSKWTCRGVEHPLGGMVYIPVELIDIGGRVLEGRVMTQHMFQSREQCMRFIMSMPDC